MDKGLLIGTWVLPMIQLVWDSLRMWVLTSVTRCTLLSVSVSSHRHLIGIFEAILEWSRIRLHRP